MEPREKQVKRIEFIMRNGGPRPFREGEWYMFSEWLNKRIPAMFPDAVVEITRHPAIHTDPEDVAALAKRASIPLPDDYTKQATR